MNILVSGGTGYIGSALVPSLSAAGHDVSVLTRRALPAPAQARHAFHWDPRAGRMDASALEGIGAVVNLAGESLAEGRWNEARKRRIAESRLSATRLLAESIARAAAPPRVLVSASAVGFYGSREDELLTEASVPGRGFLADLCREWEKATAPAAVRGVRVVLARIGLVLGPGGGALGKMLLPFRLGLGGPLGNGRQWMSWIDRDDLAGLIAFVVAREDLAGPVNAVAPEPVRNRDFARVLGKVLGRPASLPAPAWALKLLFGEMAEEALLSSARAAPAKVLAAGFSFRHPTLEGALRHALGR